MRSATLRDGPRAATTARAIEACGPFLPALGLAIALVGIFGVMRVVEVALHWSRVASTPAAWQLFPIGERFDLASAAWLLVVPAILLALLPDPRRSWARAVVATWLTVTTLAVLFLELATVPFIGEFDLRPNRLFYEQFPKFGEVARTIVVAYWAPLAVSLTILLIAAVVFGRWYGRLCSVSHAWGPLARTAAMVPIAMLLFLAARGSLSHRAINISTAAFTNNQLVNQLALNSSYSLAYSIYSLRHEQDARKIYGQSMAPAEVVRVVRETIGADASDAPAESPLLHRHSSRGTRSGRPPNVVIVLEESLGAEYVGALGGLPLTPRFDELSERGLLLTQLYCTGTRTVRGIEAVVSGFPPSPGRSVVKLSLSQSGFFTLGELLERQGYATEFIYGGESRFDNMGSFFAGNGFQRIYDLPDFAHPRFLGTWGVSDEDLFAKAHEIFLAHGDRPFLAVLLSTSNHGPFEYPDDTIVPYEQPKNTRHNAAKYADYALGKFLDVALASPYGPNTVFVVVADHSERTYGNQLVPVDKFHVPGLILGPGVPRGRFDEIASSLDLGPTILDLLDLDVEHPMVGQSVLRPPARSRRAIMQFNTSNAYMAGDRVVVHMPQSPPLEFRYADGQLLPVELEPELEHVALAHALLPSLIYGERAYRGATRPDATLRAGVADATITAPHIGAIGAREEGSP